MTEWVEATPGQPKFAIEKPTGALRFVARSIDGRELRILQQQWEIVTQDAPYKSLRTSQTEWRDIPLVDEATGT